MTDIQMREVSSRLGVFCIIKIGSAVLITPCDTRMKIMGVLAKGEMTSDEITQEIGVAYSTVMDHMDALERLGLVTTLLRRNGGRRRMYFRLSEDPMDTIEGLFAEALTPPPKVPV